MVCMGWFKAWLLKGLLGLIWVVPIWMSCPSDQTAVSPELCTSLETLNDQLNSSFRRRYLKHNFPINYTIQVRYEEVFRVKNISKLMNKSADTKSLRDLWFRITDININNILKVLPERHPSRQKYLKNLESLFKTIQQSWYFEEDNYPESITDIFDHLQKYQGWKSVKPKSLLDNCYRTMHCLFQECFSKNGSQYDYSNTQHRREGNGT